MDPISIIIEFEIATMLLAGVAGLATWFHHRQSERAHKQREVHHREMVAQRERHQHERLNATETVVIETGE